jgi:hypothetical protein
MLADKPEYLQFSKILAESKVAEEANQFWAATLLVVTNKMVLRLSALPVEKQR